MYTIGQQVISWRLLFSWGACRLSDQHSLVRRESLVWLAVNSRRVHRALSGRHSVSALQRLFVTVLAVACACLGLYGQATSGNIIGTVTDPAGAVIPNVKITITSQERGTAYNATTNESGNYSQIHILPGLYTLEFEAAGFQRFVQKDVAVGLDRSTRVDAQLVVGQVTEQVSVTGAPPPLVTDRAEVSAGLVSAQVSDLPTLNRNFTVAATAHAGCTKDVVATCHQ